MRKQATILIPIILMLITTSLFTPQLPKISEITPAAIQSDAVVSSSWISINQTVTGSLNPYHPESDYGIYLDVGQYNITLGVSSTALLGFELSKWVIDNLYPVSGTVSSPGVGQNASTILTLPTFAPTGPGNYIIRVLRPSFPSAGVFGSYSLTVRQTGSFHTILTNRQQNFTDWSDPNVLLYETTIPAFGTYNITLSTNDTTADFFTILYEDDINLPLAYAGSFNGKLTFLAPLASGEVYLEAIPFSTFKSVKGSLSLNLTGTATISPSMTLHGTVGHGQDVYYYANLTTGYYYNVTLEVGTSQNLDLRIFSPSTGLGFGLDPIATSANPTPGANESISNLVVFYFSSYAVDAQGNLQVRTTSTPPGPMPDRVLIDIHGSSVSLASGAPYNLTLTRTPFPTLAPNTPATVHLNSTSGPYYKFFTTTQASPSAYNITYQHRVWGTGVSWGSSLYLTAAEKSFKVFSDSAFSGGFGSFFIQHLFLTPQSFQTVANKWVSEFATSNATSDNDSFSRNFTMGIPPFAYMENGPIYIGVEMPYSYGKAEYSGSLSYSATGATPVSVGVTQNDFLSGIEGNSGNIYQVNIFKATLKAGHTYKVSFEYSALPVLSAVYSSQGFMQPANPPLLTIFITNDPNLPENSYYYLFTPTVTGDYYIVNTGPAFNFFGSPSIEGSYTLLIQETAPPSLLVSVTAPASKKVGESFNVAANVTNNGNYMAENVYVNLSLPGALTILSPIGTVNLGNLAPGQTVQTTWNVNSTSPGNYAIDVMAVGSNVATTHQPSSIAVTAPSLQLAINSPATASEGGSFQVQVTVMNKGNAAAGSTTVQLTLPAGLTTTPSSQAVSSLAPGQSQTLTWTVNAQTAGNYTITAKANEQYAGSATTVAAVSVPPTPPPWTVYLLAAAIISILVGFLGGYTLASRRKKGSIAGNMPPPPASPSK